MEVQSSNFNQDSNFQANTKPLLKVIPNLERRYLETDSDYVHKNRGYMRILECPTCKGKRLKPEYWL